MKLARLQPPARFPWGDDPAARAEIVIYADTGEPCWRLTVDLTDPRQLAGLMRLLDADHPRELTTGDAS